MKKFALREKRIKLVAGKALYCDRSIESPETAAKVLGRERFTTRTKKFLPRFIWTVS